jgi:RNA polymerase sigma factor (TIGR02999 family)
MRRERADHSLQTTGLVNESYIRLVDYKRMQWQNRAHFFAVSAQLMRRILVERARRQNIKRGRGVQHVPLDETAVVSNDPPFDFIVLDDALNALARVDPRKVQVVEMRFFGGLTVEESAEVLKISPVTVRHAPIAFINGGPKDLAYNGAVSGFEAAQKVAALHAWQDVGHYPATFRQPNGGAFAVAVNAWLDWHLKSDRVASKMFVGPDCGLCSGTKWNVQMKNVGSNTEEPKEKATR